MTEPLSEDELAGLKALADAATPGPWDCGRDPYHYDAPEITKADGAFYVGVKMEDAAFIAGFNPQTALRLLHHIDALKAELAREERSHSSTIDARDMAEDALSEIWGNVFGGDPGWSNLYGFSNAVNDIDAEFQKLRSDLATARTSALKEAAEVASKQAKLLFLQSRIDGKFKMDLERAAVELSNTATAILALSQK